MNVNDFLVSLGFDTKKIESQIKGIETKLQGMAASVGVKVAAQQTKQVKEQAEKKQKIELSYAEKLIATKERLKKAAEKRELERQAKASMEMADAHVKQFQKKKPTKEVISKPIPEQNAHIVQFQKQQAKLSKQKLSDEQIVQRAIDARLKEQLKREQDILNLKKAQAAASEYEWKMRRRKAVEKLVSVDSNPQLKAMSSFYKKVQSNDTDIGNKSEMIRRRRQLGTLRNTQSFKDLSKDFGSVGRDAAAQFLVQARSLLKQGRTEAFRDLRSDVQKQVRDLRKGLSGTVTNQVEVTSRKRNLADYITKRSSGRGMDKEVTEQFSKKIISAKTIVEANQYARILDNISARMSALDGQGKKELLRIVSTGQIDSLQRFNAELARSYNEMNRAKYKAFSLANAQDALSSSTRNLVREYASLYMALAGVGYIKEQAKAMDGVAAGMTAVSKDAQEVAHNIAFIKEEALKNGLAVGEAAKSYVKLKAAIGDKATLQETEQMFQSLTKAGVVFQLSQDDMTGTIKAVSQMFAKGKIQAEEMRSQLGDRIPVAMRALELSSGKTSAELEKMLEQGQLTSEYIMPMVMAMGQLASANGAYEKALVKLGTVENRMKASGGLAASRIGEAGFTEGLISLYEKLIETFNTNEHALKELGKVFNVFFKAIKKGIDIILPPLKALIRVFGSLARVLEYLAQNPMKAAELGILGIGAGLLLLYKKTGSLKAFGAAMTAAFRSPLFILMSIVGLLDEVRAYFDADVIGLFDNPNMSQEQRDKEAQDRRTFFGFGVDSNKQVKESPFLDAVNKGTGSEVITSMLQVLTNTGEKVLTEFYNRTKDLVGKQNLYGFTASPSMHTFNVVLPIMIDGKEISRKVMNDVTNQQKASMATSMPAGGQ